VGWSTKDSNFDAGQGHEIFLPCNVPPYYELYVLE